MVVFVTFFQALGERNAKCLGISESQVTPLLSHFLSESTTFG